MRGRALLTVAALAATTIVSAGLGSGPVDAATPPAGFGDVAIESFSTPTTVEWLPGNRIVVLEKGGTMHVGRPGEDFSNVVSLSVCSGSEEGLLGLTPDPNFDTNGYVYVYYTTFNGAACVNRVSRFTMADDEIDTGTEVILLDNIASTGTNHNGGDLNIGADGYLYVAIGDAGTDPRGDSGSGGSNDAAQDRSILNGSIARITLAGDPAAGNPFSGPGTAACATLGLTNPPGTTCQEIYSWGLRNPYRIAFDNDGDRFYINDVGQVTYEEVSVGGPGDFGWPTREGFCDQGEVVPCDASGPDVIDPIAAYGRADGIYITAGAFVPDVGWPAAYDGLYLFADGGSGDIWQMNDAGDVDYASPFATGAFGLTDMVFGLDGDGATVLYYVGEGIGLRKIIPPGANPGADPDPTPDPNGADALWIDPISPIRAYDTGDGTGVPSGAVGDVPSRTARQVDLDPPADAQAALINITMADTAASGNLRTWETGTPRPETSSVNAFGVGSTVGNAVVVALDDDGTFSFETSVEARVIVDVMAWMRTADDGMRDQGRFVALDAARLIDTREPSGDTLTSGSPNPWFDDDGELTDDDAIGIGVAGYVGVPADAAAAVVSIAAIPKPGLQGRATLSPAGAPRPATSSVNVTPGEVRNNMVVVPLTSGQTNIRAYTKNLDDVVIDVLGYITSAAAPESSSGLFVPVAPTRVVDTRDRLGIDPLVGGASSTLTIPDVPDIGGVGAVAQTITVTNPAGDGWLVAHASPTTPVVSNLNYRIGQTRGTLAFTSLAAGPTERFTARVATDIVVDVVGYFTE